MNPGILTVTLNPALDLTATLNTLTLGSVNRVRSEQEDAGGKGVNVASFLADFSMPVTVTGFLGEENAQAFKALFSAKGIHDEFLMVEGRTRTNIKLIHGLGPETEITDVNFPGFQVRAEYLPRLVEKIQRVAKGHEWCVISGSLPGGVPATFLRELVQLIKGEGIKVLLDTSGEALVEGLKAKPDCIKPNQHELGVAIGQELATVDQVKAAAIKLQADGISTVIVSMGEKGAVFCDRRMTVIAVPPPCEVVSTVGAGDAMVAGFVLAQMRGLPLKEASQLASAFSLAVLSQLGPRLSSREAVDAWVSQVKSDVI